MSSDLAYDPKDGWADFRKWLAACHASVLPPTNQWEIYRAETRLGILVGYRSSRGKINHQPLARPLVDMWQGNNHALPPSLAVDVVPRRGKSGGSSKIIKAIRARDGKHAEVCFYCGSRFTQKNPETVEHFLPRAKGGPNSLHNYVLACQPCNNEADTMSLVEKVMMRERKRRAAYFEASNG